MSNSTRNIRLGALSAALAALLGAPPQAFLVPGALVTHPADGLQLAAVRPPIRTIRPRTANGRPADLEERLRILREHGERRRSQSVATPQASPATAPPLAPYIAPPRKGSEPAR